MAKEEQTVADPEPKTGDAIPAGPAPDASPETTEAEDESPLLDHRLAHAAERMGLDEDDLKALGNKAETVLGKFADSLDEMSGRFAEFGRVAAPAPPAGAYDRTTPPAQSLPDEILLSTAKFDELGEEFAGPLREGLVKPVETALQGLHAQMREMQAWIGEQEGRRTQQVVDGFFEGIADRYGDVYGQQGKRTQRQDRLVREAVQLADQMLAGAAARGMNLSEREALENAVYLHQKPQDNERRVRDGTTSLKAKSKEVGPKPTARGKTTPTGREARLKMVREWRRKAIG